MRYKNKFYYINNTYRGYSLKNKGYFLIKKTCFLKGKEYSNVVTTCGEMDITTVFGTVIPGSSPGGWTDNSFL